MSTEVISVAVPNKYAKWFRKHRAWPVQVEVAPRTVRVVGGQIYGTHAVKGRMALFRVVNGEALPMGEISKAGVWKPLSDAARHDLGAIRAALYKTTYPAPLAYEMSNRDMVHPGLCFQRHTSGHIRKTHFSVVDEEQRCEVCGESFE